MLYKFLVTLLMCLAVQNAFCQPSISGKILDEKTRQPVEYASITIADRELWAISNEKGEFVIKNVLPGNVQLIISCLGYVKKT
ncbi:MAG: carboxypeptidase-like regulatory domain-containing protein, partial [Dysgonamonadaceae bacterium]|nr:carboxypeptidase-like regulatory domain-containing protein [Dysgonamonadaceae bacterium]